MKPSQTLLLAFLLLSASHASAQDYSETYTARVCNEGQITVDVATASKDFYPILPGEYWVIERWFHVRPGECKQVFYHQYGSQGVLRTRSFPLHLAFAFTDSTGVWGAARVKPPSSAAPSHLQLCVTKNDVKYREEDVNPATACKNDPRGFLIPASIDYEPTSGDQYDRFNGEWLGPKFAVALGPNDRAIPLGPQASPSGAPQGPGTILEFAEVLTSIIKSSGKTADPNWDWSACIEPVVVKTHVWKNPPVATLTSLQQAVLQFLSIHKGTANPRSLRPNHVRFKITERSGNFVLEEYSGGSCDPYYGIG
jgi:hypothetical protein